jgi:hypothetical protein
MFEFDLRISTRPENFYRKSSTAKTCLNCRLVKVSNWTLYRRDLKKRGLLPVILCSFILEKGVYFNPYFTMNDPDPKARLIFSITILCQYNKEKKEIKAQGGDEE